MLISPDHLLVLHEPGNYFQNKLRWGWLACSSPYLPEHSSGTCFLPVLRKTPSCHDSSEDEGSSGQALDIMLSSSSPLHWYFLSQITLKPGLLRSYTVLTSDTEDFLVPCAVFSGKQSDVTCHSKLCWDRVCSSLEHRFVFNWPRGLNLNSLLRTLLDLDLKEWHCCCKWSHCFSWPLLWSLFWPTLLTAPVHMCGPLCR